MRDSNVCGVSMVAVLLGGLSCRDGRADTTAGTAGMWTGRAHITMSKATSDITIGYTMQSDFWFRVDAAGNVRGKAYAAYQPTFNPAGLNGKINMAKSVVAGALSLLPGGEIAVVGRGLRTVGKATKGGIEGGKGAANFAVSGLIGVVLRSDDKKPIREGAITGSLRGGQLTLRWADKQPTDIPVDVSLQYVNDLVPLTRQTLQTQVPWFKPASIDSDSGGRFAISHDSDTPDRPSKDGVTRSWFAYWSATRVD